jgi:hypothetical protein
LENSAALIFEYPEDWDNNGMTMVGVTNWRTEPEARKAWRRILEEAKVYFGL